MNRNIVTADDVRTLAESVQPVPVPTDRPAAPVSVDTYMDRLIKYVPVEVIGCYLLLEGILRELFTDDSLKYALAVLFAVGLALTWLVAKYVLDVERHAQIVVSMAAFAVWVFATGGWFKEVFSLQAGWGSIAVVGFGLLVGIVRMPPLPQPKETLHAL